MQPVPKPKQIRSQAILRLVRKEAEARCQYIDPAIGLTCEHAAEGEPHHILSEHVELAGKIFRKIWCSFAAHIIELFMTARLTGMC